MIINKIEHYQVLIMSKELNFLYDFEYHIITARVVYDIEPPLTKCDELTITNRGWRL